MIWFLLFLLRSIDKSLPPSSPGSHTSNGGSTGGGSGSGAAEDVARATRDCQLAHVARYGHQLPMDRLISLFRHSERIGRDYM